MSINSIVLDIRKSIKNGVRLDRKMRQNVTAYLFILPWLISLLVLSAYPILSAFYLSATDYTIMNTPTWVGLRQYVDMFTKDPLYWKSVYNSFYYAILAVPLQLMVALALALLLNMKAKGVGIFRTIYYLPSLVPVVAATIMWIFLFDPRSGVVNAGLNLIGLPSLGWLKSAAWSKPALILMSLWGATGWQMLIFLASLKEIPKVYYEAAMVDGASSWQRLLKITFPLVTPALLFNLVMGVIESFQVFSSAYVATAGSGGSYTSSGGPLNSLLVYLLLLYRYGFRYFQMGYASAMSVVLFLALVIITFLLFKFSGKWVFYEGAMHR
jgi:multiple sugar transport system permease protein